MKILFILATVFALLSLAVAAYSFVFLMVLPLLRRRKNTPGHAA